MKDLIKLAKANRVEQLRTILVQDETAYAYDCNILLRADSDLPNGFYSVEEMDKAAALSRLPVVIDSECWQLPEIEDEPLCAVTIRAEDVQTVAHAMAKKDMRYHLNGFFLPPNGDMVATDGHRLVCIARAHEGFPEKFEHSGLSGVIVREDVVRFLSKKGVISVRIFKNFVQLGDGVFVRIVEGTFPNYGRLIPRGEPLSGGIDRGMVKRALAVAKATKAKYAAIAFENGHAYMSGEDLGETDMLGSYRKRIGFNAEYLRDAIDGSISVHNDSMMKITNGETVEVIMSMRV